MVELSQEDGALWRRGFAGDVLNTLWYARARMGDDDTIGFYSAVGDDAASGEMRDFITEAGIDTTPLQTLPNGVPGLYMIHLDGFERSFSYWRSTSAARQMMTNIDALWSAVSKPDFVYFSGISIAILSPEHREAMLDGIRAHMKEGAQLVFDPNIRPRLWENDAVMRDTITKAAGVADIVLPSFDDERDTFGDKTPDETAARYLAGGARKVIVKNGEEPTLMATPDLQTFVDVPPVSNVVDTTAAGDSFAGGYLSELAASGDDVAAVRAGQATAATCISFKGALAPFSEIK